MEGIGTAAESRDQFLQLLVTQLRHQDPLEPTKQEDFLAQLAQFSTVEGVEKLNENLDNFLSTQSKTQADLIAQLQQFQNMTSATGLVGKEVEFEKADGNRASGVVDAVVIDNDSVSLRVDSELIKMSQLQTIGAAVAS